MRSAASLNVDALDIDHAKGISRNDTTLIKTESIFSLGLRLVHEAFADIVAVVNQAVGHVLDFLLFLGRQAFVVRDVKMGLLCRLLGSGLPDVWAKHLPTGSKDNVCSRVMGLKLSASGLVDRTTDLASFHFTDLSV